MDVALEIRRLSSGQNRGEPELLPQRLMLACAEVLPVAGAGVSIFSTWNHRVPLGASGPAAIVAERLQFTVGDGPCFAAHAGRAVVVASEAVMVDRWPAFHSELRAGTPFRSIVSVPVGVGADGGAAVDFYYEEESLGGSPGMVSALELAADTVGDALLATLPGDLPPSPDHGLQRPAWLNGQTAQSRSLVWIALGMINFGLSLDEKDALSRLRSFAYGQGRTVDEVAAELIDRRTSVQALAL